MHMTQSAHKWIERNGFFFLVEWKLRVLVVAMELNRTLFVYKITYLIQWIRCVIALDLSEK